MYYIVKNGKYVVLNHDGINYDLTDIRDDKDTFDLLHVATSIAIEIGGRVAQCS